MGDDRLVIFARIKCLVEKFGDCILIECFIKQKMIKKIKDKMFSLNFCFVTKTRLISIVSKPILIVVVVVGIDVVFVKNMLGPKKFG